MRRPSADQCGSAVGRVDPGKRPLQDSFEGKPHSNQAAEELIKYHKKLVPLCEIGVRMEAKDRPRPNSGEQSFAGGVALVTGATGKIGRQIAASLAERGMDVVVTCRPGREDACKAIARQLGSQSAASSQRGTLFIESVDLENPTSLKAFLHRVAETHGSRLRVLVNAAALFDAPGGGQMPGPSGDRRFMVNVLAYFETMATLLPVLRRNAPSSVVNVASLALNKAPGCNGSALPAPFDLDPRSAWPYARAKAAELLLTLEASRRFRDAGVFVNAVHPGDLAYWTPSWPGEQAPPTPPKPVELREQTCCRVNTNLNALAGKHELAQARSDVVPTCCDTAQAAAANPVRLALEAPKGMLTGGWWGKAYLLATPPCLQDLSLQQRLWDLCSGFSDQRG